MRYCFYNIIQIVAIPIVSISADSLYTAIGNTITIKCDGSSTPSPTTVIWMRNSTNLNGFPYDITTININGSFTTSTLKINASRHEDAGSYDCTFTNVYSKTTSGILPITILGTAKVLVFFFNSNYF